MATINQINDALRQQLQTIDSHFTVDSTYTTWVDFKCGNLHFNTNQQNISINNKSISGNLISALRFEKNGSGSANSFTLTAYYAPTEADDPNVIDNAISGTLASAMTSCMIQFGYSFSGQLVSSATYIGSIFDYSVEVQNNMLVYTFTGYSNAAAHSGFTFDLPAITEKTDIKSIIDKALLECYRETILDKFDKDKVVTAVIHNGVRNYSDTIRTALNELKEAKEETLANCPIEVTYDDTVNTRCAKMTFGGASDVNFFEFLDELLGCARDDYSKDMIDLQNNKVTHFGEYYYIVQDTGKSVTDKIKIKICRREVYPTVYNSSYTFYWGAAFNKNSGCNLVQNFRTEYKGAINLAINNAGQTTSYSIDEDGNLVATMTGTNGSSTASTVMPNDIARNNNQYINGLQYSYKATLTTLGVPFDIPIGTYITINCVIGNQKHHTSGVYMVIGTEDNISTNGFITTWSLIKMCDSSGNTDNKLSDIAAACLAYAYADNPNEKKEYIITHSNKTINNTIASEY